MQGGQEGMLKGVMTKLFSKGSKDDKRIGDSVTAMGAGTYFLAMLIYWQCIASFCQNQRFCLWDSSRLADDSAATSKHLGRSSWTVIHENFFIILEVTSCTRNNHLRCNVVTRDRNPVRLR